MPSFAVGLNLSGDISGVLTIPDVSPSDIDTKLGYGVRATPALELTLSDYLAVRASAGYELTTWGTKSSVDLLGVNVSNSDADYTTQFLTVGAAGEFYFVPRQAFVSVGASVDFPLVSSRSDKVTVLGISTTSDGDVTGDQTSVFLDAGVGFLFTPAIGLVVGYRYPLVAYYDKEGETDKLQQVTVGLRFTLP
jgi:hypothetical protein